MKKVLVAGAGGFIGHHLVNYLKQRDYWVRGVDTKHPEFQPTRADDFRILDLREFANCMQATRGIEEVYQLAADMGGIGYITVYHAAVLKNNALINLNMLEAAHQNKVEKYLFSSSACIYPRYLQNKTDAKLLKEEDTYPADAEPGYGWEKLFAELACQYYRKDYGMQTHIVRFHSMFGPLGCYEGGREKSPAAICLKIALAKKEDAIEVWGDGCFPSGELIISNPELKCIEDFKINDLVLGINGFQRVTNTFNRNYNGDLFTIKPKGMMPFKVTAEHPILIFRLETFCKACGSHWCKPDCRKCYHSRCRHEVKFWKGWAKASEILKDRDYLCIPKLKKESLVRIDLRPYTLEGHGNGRLQEQASIPIIEVNEDWAWILGLYLAEGYSYNKKVSWCLGSHEKELREELHSRLKKIGLKWWEDNKKSAPWSRETHIANAPLSRWLRESFHSSSKKKIIPSIFFYMPKRQTREFINGYFRGDATSESIYSSKRWKATSASKDILVDIQVLLSKIGTLGTIVWLDDWGGRGRPCGTISYAERPKNVHWFQDEDYIYVPIRNISKENFKGKVYNLETEDHTYCLPVTVHNCQTRSYCYIDDCMEGIYRLMQSDFPGPINLGQDRLVTIDTLVDMIANIAGKKITKRYDLTKPQGVRGRNADITLAKKILGWQPQVSLEEGLEITYNWIYEQLVKSGRINK